MFSGSYCPTGSVHPSPCQPGSICENPSQMLPCPAGSYCPTNTTQAKPCSLGECESLITLDRRRLYACCSSRARATTVSGCYALNLHACWSAHRSLHVHAPGTFCPSGSAHPLQCDEGKLCASASLMEPCPAGSYCPTNSSQARACSPGNYCPQGSSQVANCLPRFVCETPARQEACPAGSYCPESTSVPIRCVLKSYCPASSLNQSSCPAGSFCQTAASIAPCPEGSECPEGSTEAVQCGAGFYSNASSAACTKCPSGLSTGGPGATNVSECSPVATSATSSTLPDWAKQLLISVPSAAASILLFVAGVLGTRRHVNRTWIKALRTHPHYTILNHIRQALQLNVGTVTEARQVLFIQRMELLMLQVSGASKTTSIGDSSSPNAAASAAEDQPLVRLQSFAPSRNLDTLSSLWQQRYVHSPAEQQRLASALVAAMRLHIRFQTPCGDLFDGPIFERTRYFFGWVYNPTPIFATYAFDDCVMESEFRNVADSALQIMKSAASADDPISSMGSMASKSNGSAVQLVQLPSFSSTGTGTEQTV